MQLCFDATRFGFGLQEAVELASAKNIPAVEYTFEPFDVTDEAAKSLSAQEKEYLKEVAAAAAKLKIEIACIKLSYPLKVSDESQVKKFQDMLVKLGKLAEAISCSRIIFYLEPEIYQDWTIKVEKALSPVLKDLSRAGVKLLLSLSTPINNRGRSLKFWRSVEPQEWRDFLAAMPELSLSFSAADCLWQGIDYLRILPGLIKAVDHVEAGDVEINRQILTDGGMFGPLWWRYKLPGKGQVDWRQLCEALKLYEFNGNFSIQLDDEFIGADYPELSEALDHSVKLLAPLVKY